MNWKLNGVAGQNLQTGSIPIQFNRETIPQNRYCKNGGGYTARMCTNGQQVFRQVAFKVKAAAAVSVNQENKQMNWKLNGAARQNQRETLPETFKTVSRAFKRHARTNVDAEFDVIGERNIKYE